jgi:hypothetical protein
MLGFKYGKSSQNQYWHPVIELTDPIWPNQSQSLAADAMIKMLFQKAI